MVVDSAKSKFLIGASSALLAAILFGASTPLAKLLVGQATPTLVAGLLYLGSGLGLGTLWFLGMGVGANKLQPGDYRGLAFAVFFGGILGPLFLMFGLSLTQAATASLLLNLEGVFTAVLAWLIFKERFNLRIGLGMLLIFCGGLVLSWSGSLEEKSIIGVFFICAACFSWGLDNNFTRSISQASALQIAAIKGLVAGLINTTIGVCLSSQSPSAQVLVYTPLLGFFSYGASLCLFVIGLRHVGAARTGAYFSTAPFVGALVAVLLGDTLQAGTTIAGGLMAMGVYLHLTEARQQ